MITLKEVVASSSELSQIVDAEAVREMNRFFDHSAIKKVVVWPDEIASKILEGIYLLDTHFVPGGLPACGMSIGDFFVHQEATYLTLHQGVACNNAAAFHLVRGSEAVYREWNEQCGRFDPVVRSFLDELSEKDRQHFPEEMLENYLSWRTDYVGWTSLSAPNRAFVDSLSLIAESGSDKKNEAARLVNELRPFAGLPERMEQIRKALNRKGFPRISDDMFHLTSPAMSGGASWHSDGAGDDIKEVLPGLNLLTMIVGQTPQAHSQGLQHIGGGKLQGRHYTILPPKTPFFLSVQELVDVNEALRTQWAEIRRQGYRLEDFDKWQEATKAIKREVAKDVIPIIIRDRMLGWYLDLVTEPRIINLAPIVAESALLVSSQTLINEVGWELNQPEIADLLLEDRDGYYHFDSAFD